MTRLGILAILMIYASAALASSPPQDTTIDPRPGAVVPLDTAFRDETGALVTLRKIADGKPLLLVPVVHNCPNICGVTLAGLLTAVDGQPLAIGQGFAIVAFGIDPREHPAAASASLARLHSAFPIESIVIHGLTGSADDIRAVTDALGYRYEWDGDLGQYAHIAAVAVLTGDGRLDRWLYGISPDPVDLKLAVLEAGEGRIGSWSDQLLLLCYHYDPITGRYSAAIWTMVRVGGLIIVAVLAGLVFAALIRDHRAGRSHG